MDAKDLAYFRKKTHYAYNRDLAFEYNEEELDYLALRIKEAAMFALRGEIFPQEARDQISRLIKKINKVGLKSIKIR